MNWPPSSGSTRSHFIAWIRQLVSTVNDFVMHDFYFQTQLAFLINGFFENELALTNKFDFLVYCSVDKKSIIADSESFTIFESSLLEVIDLFVDFRYADEKCHLRSFCWNFSIPTRLLLFTLLKKGTRLRNAFLKPLKSWHCAIWKLHWTYNNKYCLE